ncbi:hypothetical protein O6P43_017306 [Quillaja saponaria]|uniref:Uncharacterized protein n=1 Tax=Quillaja saponaria TaxID=32244 RepID=A0AAD7LPW3_QUISA|nr:hypothetical protein O6P43_017306 [Quillaja saponaria]
MDLQEDYECHIIEKYGEDFANYLLFDEEIWLQVFGEVKKRGKLYGYEMAVATRTLFGDKISISRSSFGSTITSQPTVEMNEQEVMKLMMEQLSLNNTGSSS